MRTSNLPFKHLAALGVAAALLAGCGSSDDSGDASGSSAVEQSDNGLADQTGQVVASAAADALEEAGAAHAAGSITSDGEQLDLDLQFQGEDAAGTITVAGQTIELINLSGTAYLKAPAEFWASSGVPAEVLPQLDGVWVMVPAGATTGLEDFSLAGFVDQLRNPTGVVQDEVTTAEVDGQAVVEVTEDDGSVLRVLAEGEPYPLQLENTGDEAGVVTFSDFGQEQTIEAPQNPLDLSTLGG